MSNKTDWYKEAVVYQIYPLSFKDSNNDGMGDIPGIISKLDYIRDLGVTAIWFSPLYASPWKDYGYDISDYRAIHPAFGTMEDFDRLVNECHRRGLKVIMDMVVNHTSDQHEWFKSAMADENSPYRDYYIIRKGRRIAGDQIIEDIESGVLELEDKIGEKLGVKTRVLKAVSEHLPGFKSGHISRLLGGKLDASRDSHTSVKGGLLLPPTNWTSSFTGSAWERIEGTDNYYLHLFAPEQPDLNWENPAVRDEIVDILKFWMDKGVDGFRFDVFNLFSKVYPMRDDPVFFMLQRGEKSFVDGPRMHEFLKELNERALSLYDSYTVGESYKPDPEHAHRYIMTDSHELDTIFDFEHLTCDNVAGLKYIPKKFDLKQFKHGLFAPQLKYYKTGWNTLVLENHDSARSVSRFSIDTEHYRYQAATFLATITFMGWGTPFIYQGEEIGMTNSVFGSIDEMKDPVSHFIYDMMTKDFHFPHNLAFKFICSGARDHARTPMQWDDTVNAGFNSGAQPWQSINPNYREINAHRDLTSDKSIYRFYQQLLALKKSDKAALYGSVTEYEEDNKRIIMYSRTYEGRRLLIAGNFSRISTAFRIPDEFRLEGLKPLLVNYGKPVVRREMRLRPYQAVVFECL